MELGDVEPVRVRIRGRVAIRGGEQHRHPGPGWQHLTGEFQLGQCVAGDELDRRVEAEEFLDRAGDQARIGELVRSA